MAQLQKKTGPKASLSVSSGVIEHGKDIPVRFTCDGANVSPPLDWGQTPEGTLSFTVLAEDPDAPGKIWSHWVLFNLPPGSTSLDEGIPSIDRLPNRAIQGRNDFGKVGYGGPCPPSGAHRYFFRVYAVDRQLDLDALATRDTVLRAMEGHILAQGEIVGVYKRTR